MMSEWPSDMMHRSPPFGHRHPARWKPHFYAFLTCACACDPDWDSEPATAVFIYCHANGEDVGLCYEVRAPHPRLLVVFLRGAHGLGAVVPHPPVTNLLPC